VTSAAGCVDSITKLITVYGELIIPNIVTNNGDGVNDFFEIKNLEPNSTLIIQNRWGDVVFSTENYLNNWKGTDQSGNELLEGVYFYQLFTVDDKVWSGFIHLINK
jgi:gliding motility-associated-like protein